MESLILNGKYYSYPEIIEGHILGDTPFEQTTLRFCRQWLNGQTTFSLKTSGSTGEPKEITISREQMVLSANQTITFFNLSPADSVLVCLNTAYIAGLMMLVRAFSSGAQIIAVEPSGNPLLNIDRQVDFIAAVPLQLEQILADPDTKGKLEQCRSVIVGGAPISVALEEKIKTSAANIYATFGMTETLTHFALKQLNPIHKEAFTVLDEVVVGQDDRGCLTVSSPVTQHETLVTNDLVSLQSQNSFKWLGRVDNVINSGGVKIQIEALERKIAGAFYRLGLENRFFISSLPDKILGEKIVLVIECETQIERISKVNWLDYLAAYEKPKEILYSKRFTETATGKINRQKSLQNS